MIKKILLVEDSVDVRECLRDLLILKDFEVLEAGEGHEALELLRKQSFDLVISDLEMPRMDGMELLRQVRALGLQLPFVILTGSDRFEEFELLKAGATMVVRKPFVNLRALLDLAG